MNYLENRAKQAIVPISNSIAKVQGSLQTGSSDDSILFILRYQQQLLAKHQSQ
jgi:hypothetical protein